MWGLLRNIVVLLVSVFVCGSVMGATYTSKSSTNPGYKFEEDASWTGGSKPGTYSAGTFTVSANADIEINGYIALNGGLNYNVTSGAKLTIKKNAIFVIEGDLNISDYVDVYLEENATLYIKGNIITHDRALLDLYTDFVLGKKSNIVVEKNATFELGSAAMLYRENGNADFYIWGSRSGNIYRDGSLFKNGSGYIENKTDYENAESELIETVQKITDDLLSSCELVVPNNETIIIDEEIHVCSINMQGANSKLIISENGVINLSSDVEISQGVLTNYGKIVSSTHDFTVLPKIWNGNPYCQFYNNGIITAKNVNVGKYINYNSNDLADVRCFSLSCGSSIVATEAISFMVNGSSGQLNLLGNYQANDIVIDYESGGNTANFGADCGSSEITAEKLTLKIDNGVINIHELTNVTEVHLNTSMKFNVDGSLTLGNVTNGGWQALGVDGSESSKIIFCYNPTHEGDFGGQGTLNTTRGQVIYRYDSNDNVHSWYTNGTANDPEIENDIICNGCRMIANAVNFNDCMDGVANFLPIELVSFNFDKSRNEFVWTTASETNNDYFVVEYSKNGKDWVECTEHVQSQSDNGYTYGTEPIMPINESLFSYFRLKQVDLNGEFSYSDIITISFTVENPCSPEFEKNKIQLRELGNKWYRNINGELIYCENDNE